MTTPMPKAQRRLHAAILGFGLDNLDDSNRIATGPNSLVVGGSAETHADLTHAIAQLEFELLALDRSLGDLEPAELGALAERIDLPELAEIADRIQAGIELRGISFIDLSADELTELSVAGLF